MRGKTSTGTYVGFVIILLWCLLPVVWIISLSFKTPAETATGSPQFLPKDMNGRLGLTSEVTMVANCGDAFDSRFIDARSDDLMKSLRARSFCAFDRPES